MRHKSPQPITINVNNMSAKKIPINITSLILICGQIFHSAFRSIAGRDEVHLISARGLQTCPFGRGSGLEDAQFMRLCRRSPAGPLGLEPRTFTL